MNANEAKGTALITGASTGLGKRFAQVLSQAGAKVVLASRRVERLKELRAEIEASGGAAHVVSLDVTDYQSIKAAVAHAETEAGTIDILVNNSGVSTTQRLAEVTPADFEYVFDTNTRGAFFVAQEVAKRMIMRGGGANKPPYRIINIASVAGLRVLPQIGLYSMSKAAVIALTASMQLEAQQPSQPVFRTSVELTSIDLSVLDSQGRLPVTAELVRTAQDVPTVVVTAPHLHPERTEPLRKAGCEVLPVAIGGQRPSVAVLLQELGRRRMTNILVEGGSGVLGSFFDADAQYPADVQPDGTVEQRVRHGRP